MNNTEQTIIREPDFNQIETFSGLVHGKLGGLIDVRAFSSDGRFQRAQQIFAEDINESKEFIRANIDKNICCGIASRIGEDGSKKGCGEIPGLWVDIDFKDLPNGDEDAIALIEKFPLKPSLVVWSGHGLHLYWLFHDPVPASLEIECYLKGIAKELCADPAAAEISHVMRIPGTYNYKNKDNVVAAKIMEVNDLRYTISDFEQWKIATQHQHSNTKVEFTESTIDVDIYKFGVSTKIINLIKGEWRRHGYESRSEADQAVVTALLAKSATYDEVRAIFQCYPVGEKYREKGSAGDAYLKHCIRSATNHIAATEPKNSDLPQIDATCGDLPAMASKAWSALIKANDPPVLFEYAGKLIRIEKTNEKQATIRVLTQDRLHYELAGVAVWYKWTKWGRKQTPPPFAVVRDILARPNPPLPPLTRIIEAPMFGKDGELIITPGYHRAAQVYYSPRINFTVAPIPKQPSAQEIEAATNLILDILMDFPFVSLQERANAIPIMLLSFVRDLIDGPTPLHLIEKPSPGTGATLLAEMLMYPSMGGSLPVLTEARDDDEWRKRITTKLIEGAPVIFIDNVRRRLESSALATALTGIVWEDRLLGLNETIQIPQRCVWIATANNPVLSQEIVRRTVRIRLDAKSDRPWLNRKFKYPNLREWVAMHRADLVHACLVLIQAWIAAGKPVGNLNVGNLIGSFESWAMLMGGILKIAGIDGFLSNLNDFYEESDAEGAGWRAFVTAWFAKFDSSPVGVSSLYELISSSQEPIEIGLGEGSEQSRKIRLGKRLTQMRERVFDGFRICEAGKVNGAKQWKLTKS
jgi:hypothetical protein